MTFSALLGGLRRYAVLLIFTAILGLGLGIGFTFIQPESYETTTKIYVTTPQDTKSNLGQAYQGTLFTQERVRSYADLVSTPAVLDTVRKNLAPELSNEDLAEQITVTVPVNSVVMGITVADGAAPRSQALADQVTKQLIALVDKLESGGPDSEPAVRISIVQPAELATEPSTPRPALNVVGGLALGMLFGIILASLRNSLDTRLRDRADVTRAARHPLIGEIPNDTTAERYPLAQDGNWYGLRAEAFRQLRTNLRFVRVDEPPRTIVVTSPLPGEGKTSVAINLAFTLAQSGATVICVDADLRRPSLADHFNVVSEVGLTTALLGEAQIHDVIQASGRKVPLRIITSGQVPPNPSELLGSERMKQVVDHLAELADYVVIDTPPLLPVTDAAIIATLADGALVVTRAGSTRRDDLAGAFKALDLVSARVLGTVLNRTRARKNSELQNYAPDETPKPKRPRSSASTARGR